MKFEKFERVRDCAGPAGQPAFLQRSRYTTIFKKVSNMNSKLAIFEDYKIRRVYDEDTETWYFSVVDILQALLQQPDYQTARKYWNKLRERLSKEGSESVTNCHRLKLTG